MRIVNEHAYEYKEGSGGPRGRGCCFEPAAGLGWTKEDMILSSCVADSLLLSLDSAGQALGTGTNSSPLSSSQPLALAMCVVKPDELGMLGEGKRPADLGEKSPGASPWREQKRDMV